MRNANRRVVIIYSGPLAVSTSGLYKDTLRKERKMTACDSKKKVLRRERELSGCIVSRGKWLQTDCRAEDTKNYLEENGNGLKGTLKAT